MVSPDIQVSLPEVRGEEGGREAGYWKKHPFSQMYYEMRPDDFLMLAEGGKRVKERIPTWSEYSGYARLCDRIRTGERIDPPRLVLEARKCGILAHEGRHRASLAWDCGVKKMPVVLTCVKKLAAGKLAKGKKRPHLGRYHLVDAQACIKCLRRGVPKMRPQQKMSMQDLMYTIHRYDDW